MESIKFRRSLANTMPTIRPSLCRTLPICSINLVLLLTMLIASSTTAQQQMKNVAAPVDNPLKELVPYARPHADPFPHSMEFSYLPLSDLIVVRVVNPLAGGVPLRFANEYDRRAPDRWLLLVGSK